MGAGPTSSTVAAPGCEIVVMGTGPTSSTVARPDFVDRRAFLIHFDYCQSHSCQVP